MDTNILRTTRFFLAVLLVMVGLPFRSSSARAAGQSSATAGILQQPVAVNVSLNVTQMKKLLSDSPQASSYFGNSFAIQGDVAVVGAANEDISGYTDLGAVYVFYRNFTSGTPDDWQLAKKILCPDTASNINFGRSVAISGSHIFVGANGVGAVYIFERNTGGINSWGQVKKIINNDGVNGIWGEHIAAHGDVLVIGSQSADLVGNNNEGAAFVFYRNQGGAESWGQVQKLTASDAAAGDNLGIGVSIYNDIIAVGAPFADISNNTNGSQNDDQGAVYLFYRNTGGVDNWGELKKISAADGSASDLFGSSISLSDDTLAVSSHYADINDHPNQGAVYLFARNQGDISNNWGLVKKIVSNDGVAANNFGVSVALSHDILAVGSSYGTLNTATEGTVYLFARNDGGADAWGQIKEIAASDGQSEAHFENVALDGNTLLVTAPRHDAGTNDSGAAYIFGLQGTGWAQAGKGSAAEYPDSKEGSAIALDGDYLVTGAPGYDFKDGVDFGQVNIYRRNYNGADGWGSFKILGSPVTTAGEAFGQAVSISDDTIAVGAPGTGKVYIFLRNAGGVVNSWGHFATISGTTGAKFGYTLSLHGDLLAVGAPSTDNNAGAVYLYERNKGGAENWGLVQTIAAPAAGAQFGLSLGLDAGSLIVGAPYANSNGAAYLYMRNEGGPDAWGLYRTLTALDAAADDHFGWSVSISDDTAAVGSPDDDNIIGVDAGSVYLFLRNQGGINAWGQKTLLTDPRSVAGERFGFSVDINKDTVLAGNPRAKVGDNLVQGSATVYERNTGGFDAWGRVQRILAGDGRADDRFGYAVALSDRFLAVGASSADVAVNNNNSDVLMLPNSGAAYIYQYDRVFSVTITKAGTGLGGSVSDNLGIMNCNTNCVVTYHIGAVVTFHGVEDTTTVFSGWSGACNAFDNCSLTMSQSYTLTATFDKTFSITIIKAGAGNGSIGDNQDGQNCNENICYVLNYAPGSTIVLTANPNANSAFAGWSGACTGAGTCSLTMTQDYTVTATFTPVFLLTVAKGGSGGGTVTSSPAGINCGTDCAEKYAPETVVTLTATPAAGSVFVGWSGADCTTGVVTMMAARTCYAYFQPIVTAQYASVAGQDGWVLESSENSNKGGSLNATLAQSYLGDDAQDRQYRALLSFATHALPDDAIITSATLKVYAAGVVGSNPFGTHPPLRGDVRKGFFGAAATLGLDDFAAAANLNNALAFGGTPASGWYIANLPTNAISFINKLTAASGLTQFRLRFNKDDNDDLGADYFKFNTGNAASNKPVLIIKYYLPVK